MQKAGNGQSQSQARASQTEKQWNLYQLPFASISVINKVFHFNHTKWSVEISRPTQINQQQQQKIAYFVLLNGREKGVENEEDAETVFRTWDGDEMRPSHDDADIISTSWILVDSIFRWFWWKYKVINFDAVNRLNCFDSMAFKNDSWDDDILNGRSVYRFDCQMLVDFDLRFYWELENCAGCFNSCWVCVDKQEGIIVKHLLLKTSNMNSVCWWNTLRIMNRVRELTGVLLDMT